jgi:PTS system mannose-specific IIA component
MADSDQQRLGVVVVTHGQLAHELVNAAEMIAGELVRFQGVALGWHDDPNAARDQIAAAVARVQGPAGVLILTDMFGGTPSNLGITFLEDDRVEVITGVNLPMLVKLANLDRSNAGLLGIARQVREHAREAIRVASDLMRPDAGS